MLGFTFRLLVLVVALALTTPTLGQDQTAKERAQQEELERKKRREADDAYRMAKNEFLAARKLRLLREALKGDDRNSQEGKELRELVADRYREIMTAFPGTQAAIDAAQLLDGKEVRERPAPPDPDGGKSDQFNFLPDADKCLDVATRQAWAEDLKQIPATVIDKGVMRSVPYQSYRAGDYEMNIYGDPDHPAGVEIGVYSGLLRSKIAKNHCVEFMAAVLTDPGDRYLLRSLKLTIDSVKRGNLTFEITPETADDAYGGWWVSVYNTKALDKARASAKELAAITVDKQTAAKAPAGLSWSATGPCACPLGSSKVYARGYYRDNDTYTPPTVQADNEGKTLYTGPRAASTTTAQVARRNT